MFLQFTAEMPSVSSQGVNMMAYVVHSLGKLSKALKSWEEIETKRQTISSQSNQQVHMKTFSVQHINQEVL